MVMGLGLEGARAKGVGIAFVAVLLRARGCCLQVSVVLWSARGGGESGCRRDFTVFAGRGSMDPVGRGVKFAVLGVSRRCGKGQRCATRLAARKRQQALGMGNLLGPAALASALSFHGHEYSFLCNTTARCLAWATCLTWRSLGGCPGSRSRRRGASRCGAAPI